MALNWKDGSLDFKTPGASTGLPPNVEAGNAAIDSAQEAAKLAQTDASKNSASAQKAMAEAEKQAKAQSDAISKQAEAERTAETAEVKAKHAKEKLAEKTVIPSTNEGGVIDEYTDPAGAAAQRDAIMSANNPLNVGDDVAANPSATGDEPEAVDNATEEQAEGQGAPEQGLAQEQALTPEQEQIRHKEELAGIAADHGAATEKIETEYQQRMADIDDRATKSRAEFEQELTMEMEREIPVPHANAIQILGVALVGLGNPGGRNVALEAVMQNLDRELAASKAGKQARLSLITKRGANMERGILFDGNEAKKEVLSKARALRGLQNKLTAEEQAKHNPAVVRQNAAKLKGDLAKAEEKELQELRDKQGKSVLAKQKQAALEADRDRNFKLKEKNAQADRAVKYARAKKIKKDAAGEVDLSKNFKAEMVWSADHKKWVNVNSINDVKTAKATSINTSNISRLQGVEITTEGPDGKPITSSSVFASSEEHKKYAEASASRYKLDPALSELSDILTVVGEKGLTGGITEAALKKIGMASGTYRRITQLTNTIIIEGKRLHQMGAAFSESEQKMLFGMMIGGEHADDVTSILAGVNAGSFSKALQDTRRWSDEHLKSQGAALFNVPEDSIKLLSRKTTASDLGAPPEANTLATGAEIGNKVRTMAVDNDVGEDQLAETLRLFTGQVDSSNRDNKSGSGGIGSKDAVLGVREAFTKVEPGTNKSFLINKALNSHDKSGTRKLVGEAYRKTYEEHWTGRPVGSLTKTEKRRRKFEKARAEHPSKKLLNPSEADRHLLMAIANGDKDAIAKLSKKSAPTIDKQIKRVEEKEADMNTRMNSLGRHL